MELWSLWTHLIEQALAYLSTHLGLSDAVSIIVLTVIARALLMPVSLTAAYRMHKNKVALERIKPRIEQLRSAHKDNPSELANRTMALYREHGITFMDRVSLLNVGSQSAFGIGIYQVLRRLPFSSPFLWISNLAKPDLLLTLLVGVLMAVGFALMPGTITETSNLLLLAVPILVSVIAIAALPSTLGVYWATSNVVTITQALLLRGVLARQARFAA